MTELKFSTWFIALIAGTAVMPHDVVPVQFVPTASAGEYARSGPNPHQSRSVVIAPHGMVATSHPLAAQAGLDILREGGNAADAAIAASAMIGLVEPMSCGIGGDLFLIYWDAKTGTLHGLNASGRSPHALTHAEFQKRELTQIPVSGPLSWSVPGCVDGWDQLRIKFGTKSFRELLTPSINYANDGFPVPEVIAGYWKGAEPSLAQWEDSARTYLPEGRAPREGELFCNPFLASSYEQIAAQGRDAFYRGEIAQEIVAASMQHGGFFSMKDFEDHTSEWIEPVSTNYRGYDVWELPPNGQGIAALQILNLIEPYDVAKMGPKSADWLHLFTEAKKLAYADRARFYADPAFGTLPIAELISKPYADRRRPGIDMGKAATNVPAGDPKLQHGDTIYLTVVDKDRNCCSLIQSNFFGFGSQIVAGKTGFALQNRGALFALDDKHLNRLEPHKRPFHTIIPAFVTKDGQPWFCFGVMGGDMQPQGHVQILVNMIDFGMNIQQAGDLARICHNGTATPTGLPMDPKGGVLLVEAGISDETIAELERRGHVVQRAVGAFGGYQGILIDHEHGTLRGATESRKDGTAIGY